MIVTSPRGKYESSTTSNCHKKITNRDFGLLFWGLDQVFVQDKAKLMSGLNVKSYFWPNGLSLPTVQWRPKNETKLSKIPLKA